MILLISKILCNHKFTIKQVNINGVVLKQCKTLHSHTNSKTYNKFIIPNGSLYHKCIKCEKIKN